MAGFLRSVKKSIGNPGRTDTTLITIVAFLVAFGVIMIYSASHYHSYALYGKATHFFMRQTMWSVLGMITMLIVMNINIKFINKFNVFIYVVVIVLLVLVMFFGKEVNNSKRWLELGGMSLQPSEIAKVGMILVLSYLLTFVSKGLHQFRVLLFVLVVAGIPIVLIAETNLSTAIVVTGIVASMIFVVYKKWYLLLPIGLIPIAIGAMFFLFAEGYRSRRLAVFVEGPWTDPQGLGYQVIQSLYAIGSGGWFGVGLGQSLQKIDSLPEAHNDIIFAIICEELGLFGGVAVMLLFVALLYRLLVILNETKDMQGILIVTGVMAHIGVQVIINIAVATNSIPTTGMPMPFISYGGSSLLFVMAEMGLVLNIARRNSREVIDS